MYYLRDILSLLYKSFKSSEWEIIRKDSSTLNLRRNIIIRRFLTHAVFIEMFVLGAAKSADVISAVRDDEPG